MKAASLGIVGLCVLLAGAGCARNYSITTSSGRVITARGKPHYDRENSVFVFTDASGQERRIPAGSVSQIAPGSDKSSPTTFNATPAR